MSSLNPPMEEIPADSSPGPQNNQQPDSYSVKDDGADDKGPHKVQTHKVSHSIAADQLSVLNMQKAILEQQQNIYNLEEKVYLKQLKVLTRQESNLILEKEVIQNKLRKQEK